MKQRDKQQGEKVFILGFCIFFTIALFLGDGKQHTIDVFAAAVILLSWAAARYWRMLRRPTARREQIMWLVLVGYYVVRTIMSDSVGYSITATMRTLDAYLVYTLFYSIASPRTLRLFIYGIVGVACVAVGAAVLLLLVPNIATNLSSMNLLYATYGHNHLADVLVFVLPAVFMTNVGKKSAPLWVVTGIFLLSAVVTFARGAWLALALYFFWYFVKRPNKIHRAVAFIASALFVGLFVAWSGYIPQLMQASSAGRIGQGLFKSGIFSDPRITYWKEAAQASLERPIFGSGPGTFLLQSKRLQPSPGAYSWFAHSFPFELLVELGIVGLVLWLNLARVHIQTLRHQYKKIFFRQDLGLGKDGNLPWIGLLSSVVLTIVYGLYEFNLSFMVIWLLFWSSVGLLAGASEAEGQGERPSFLPQAIGVLVLGIFYVLSIASASATSVWHRSDRAFLFSPFDVNATIEYVLSLTNARAVLPSPQRRLIGYFHRRDPEVLLAQARLFSARGDFPEAETFYKEALSFDPKNALYQKEFLLLLMTRGQDQELIEYLESLCGTWAQVKGRCHMLRAEASAVPLAQALKRHADVISRLPNITLSLPKLFYGAGLDFVRTDPDLTKNLWMIAATLAPQWGYYSVELASLEYWTLGNPQAAKEMLVECSQRIYTASWCSPLLQNPNELPPAGWFEKNIQAIPNVLPWTHEKEQ